MICPQCQHDNIEGDDFCADCGGDMMGNDIPAPANAVQKSLIEDPVSQVEFSEASTIDAGATLDEALRQLADVRKGCLLVMKDSKLVGIFTERDILQKVAGQITDLKSRQVGDLMTPDPETLKPTDSVASALKMMYIGGYRHLPVVSDNQPTGILSIRHLLGYIARTFKVAMKEHQGTS